MASSIKHTVSASANIPAPPRRVYSIIADYKVEHPSILPREFLGLVVETGGFGAGTIIRVDMKVFGRKQTFRAAVSEPEPGRVLVETDLSGGPVTTFIFDPGPTDESSYVTFSTELQVRGGLLGKLEAYMSTRYLYPIYVRELELLALRAKEKPATAA
jgi:hypothetical protein